jgi:hypothetical protein
MPEAAPEPGLAALLRQAGYSLPMAVVAELEHGHALLRGALTRVGQPTPQAEPATVFRPGAAP